LRDSLPRDKAETVDNDQTEFSQQKPCPILKVEEAAHLEAETEAVLITENKTVRAAKEETRLKAEARLRVQEELDGRQKTEGRGRRGSVEPDARYPIK
jgi:hypothetical protein